ncbi:hypothetical protein CA85_35670 [Allorhodopirellula solitaria]|uniref:Uncharacterized protein n=1 Tax=Allorhodopirellula solitaria TaxID=2527987 RepID=A0A5C5XSU6_9BACT|nr:hypothetical protein CA85_35670 [Allorhodopirellula solitaria]
MARITLSDSELARLERILSVSDLEPQRRMAYPMFFLAAALAVGGLAFITSRPSWYFALLAFAFASVIMGFMRLGYYHLFRLLHYQSQLLAPAPGSPEAPSASPHERG